MTGVENDVHSLQTFGARAPGELRALALDHLRRKPPRIVRGQIVRQQQGHRNLHRIADRNLGDVVDSVEVHEAIEDVADVLRIHAAGESDGHRRIESLSFLQPVDGERLGRVALIRQRRLPCGNSFHCHIRSRRIRWRTLNRIVLRFPNLRSLRRCIQFLPLSAKCGGEQMLRNEDNITGMCGQRLTWIRRADRRVVLTRSGEPLGNVPERLALNSCGASRDVLPAGGSQAVLRKKRSDDLPLQLVPQQRERNMNSDFAGQLLVVEGGDCAPVAGIAGDALGQTRPGIAVMRQN